jgi:hypothetical protein
MPRKRFTNEQIAFALRQAENGATVDEVCRKMGVSEPTFYRWKTDVQPSVLMPAKQASGRALATANHRHGAGSNLSHYFKYIRVRIFIRAGAPRALTAAGARGFPIIAASEARRPPSSRRLSRGEME